MTTYVEARDTLVGVINTALSASYPTLKVFYENTVKVDTNTVGDQFVKVSVDFIAARQATIELQPKQRVLGELTFLLMSKEGKGTRTTLEMYDYLVDLLAHKTFGGVTLRTPVPGKKQFSDGWAGFEIYVPFIFDSTT